MQYKLERTYRSSSSIFIFFVLTFCVIQINMDSTSQVLNSFHLMVAGAPGAMIQVILGFIGIILFLIVIFRAFLVNFLWGIGVLVFYPLTILFAYFHWPRAGKVILLMWLFIGFATLLMYWRGHLTDLIIERYKFSEEYIIDNL